MQFQLCSPGPITVGRGALLELTDAWLLYVFKIVIYNVPQLYSYTLGSRRAVSVWSQGGIICISNQHTRCDSPMYNFTSRTHRTHGGWVTNKCITQRKLPPGIAPVKKIIHRSKSVEILSNSGLQNPALVNLMRVKLYSQGLPIHVNGSAHHSRSL